MGKNRAVILTALQVEYLAVRMHLSSLREETYNGTIYEQGNFQGKEFIWEISLVQVGAGNSAAAYEAERAISYFQPQVALFVGVAGGLKTKDVRLGDVVAATKIYGYESGKANLSFQARPDVGNSTHAMQQRARADARQPNWLQRLRTSAPEISPRVFVQAIAAGEKVVASTRSATWKFLQRNYNDAVAVEMEGHGFLKATHANQHVESLVVRGISDLIDDKSEADAADFQEIASMNASAFAFEVLANLDVKNLWRTHPNKSPVVRNVEQSNLSYSKYNNRISGSIDNFIQGNNQRVNIYHQDKLEE